MISCSSFSGSFVSVRTRVLRTIISKVSRPDNFAGMFISLLGNGSIFYDQDMYQCCCPVYNYRDKK